MQFKSFVIPLGDAPRAEGEMNAFLRSHKIITLTKEFVLNGENSFWAVLAEYIDNGSGENEKTKGSIDYKEVLSEADFSLFSHLRETRKAIALSRNVPVYVVLTNAQLAELAQKKPASLSALGQIPGIGRGKCEKYGQLFLDALQTYENQA